MKTMYVYILQCSDNSYYTSVTNNLEKRVQIHNEGLNRNCYTFLRRPFKIVYYKIFNNPNDAIAFEKQIKGWNRKKKEALILEKYELLPELSLNSIKASARSSTSSD